MGKYIKGDVNLSMLYLKEIPEILTNFNKEMKYHFHGVCLIGRQNHRQDKDQIQNMSIRFMAEEIYKELLANRIVEKCNERNNLLLFGHNLGCIVLFEVLFNSKLLYK
jgi:surfactin synthase thioesterase subunit